MNPKPRAMLKFSFMLIQSSTDRPMLTQELEGTETPPVTRVAGWIVSYCLHLAKVWVAEPLKRAAKPARGMAKFYIRARQ